MNSGFAAQVASRLDQMASFDGFSALAPGVEAGAAGSQPFRAGGGDDLPLITPPTKSEIVSALALGSSCDADSATQIRHLQVQVNLLLRLFLSRSSLSSSPRFSSSSCSPNSSRSHSNGPPKDFECPVCLTALTEKSFVRHISKWPSRVDGRQRKNSCPGIRSFDHPLLRNCPRNPSDDLSTVVQRLVDHVVRMTRPGSNTAHSDAGSGIS
jgi:hypothetical protein